MSEKSKWNRKERLLNEADEMALKADILAHESKYEEAVEYYDRALEKMPGNADLWAFKGITLEGGLNKQDEAMKCWEKAQRLDHEIAEAVDMSEEEGESAEIEGIDINSLQGGGCKEKIVRLMMKNHAAKK